METITVYILCGLIGSGKSTWARKHAGDNAVIINKDSIRTMLRGVYVYDIALEPLVKRIANDMIMSASEKYDVIIDETHITRGNRAEIINLILRSCAGVDINIVHFTETEKNVDYRMTDSRGVTRESWENVCDGMKKSFEDPTQDELKGRGHIMTVQI